MSQFKFSRQTRDSSYEIGITQKKRKKSQDWKENKWKIIKKKWCQLALAFQIHDPRK